MSKTVIIADGVFPVHPSPLGYIRDAARIVCCDGSAASLLKAGFIPEVIVGDMDSLSSEIAERYRDRIHRDESQDTNDLTKAVLWCKRNGYEDIVIVGATGKREDHTIGNISLLVEYADYLELIMVTDTGMFRPLLSNTELLSFTGQQISIFSIDPDTEITSFGLRYPLINKKIMNWWEATLNEAIGDHFSLEFTKGRVIVYQKFSD